MYGFVTHTWNPIKGKCLHDCIYCFMKRFKNKTLKPIRLSKDIKDVLKDKDEPGMDHFIFVGSSTDMFAEDVPHEWIVSVIERCKEYPDNKYLFQSKDPLRMLQFACLMPNNVIFATTLESNKEYPEIYQNAPGIFYRHGTMKDLQKDAKKMITIEPILDFDLKEFVEMIRAIGPEQVNIGADSCGHHMPEPSKEKIQALIDELKAFTKVHLKPNLKRLTR